jgi:dihydroorotate dehydrogenase (fumarate)
MDLSTTYMGMKLRSPLVVAASPLSDDVNNIIKMEEAGAAAVVLYSIFEEQFSSELRELEYHLSTSEHISAEAQSFYPEPDEYRTGPDDYLRLISEAKKNVDIPIIASFNGSTPGGWTGFAKQFQDAGADAIELNVYYIPTSFDESCDKVEQTYLDILQQVKDAVNIPVAIKLAPFFTNFARFAKKLDEAGADALVLFNRFYQPDIDLEELEVVPNIRLSHSSSTRLPLRWIAILYDRIKADLAATSGIHTGEDVLKLLMAGANITMLNSVLLKKGISHISEVEKEMVEWMTEHEYESVNQMQGSMSQKNIPDASAYERAQYMKALTSYRY